MKRPGWAYSASLQISEYPAAVKFEHVRFLVAAHWYLCS
jgi:hypothetical protein